MSDSDKTGEPVDFDVDIETHLLEANSSTNMPKRQIIEFPAEDFQNMKEQNLRILEQLELLHSAAPKRKSKRCTWRVVRT